jgi:hypothetical protein
MVTEKYGGKSPLRRSRHRWKGNFKTDLKEKGRKGVEWINLAHGK